ncbi:hypothetical protein M885DRAFT_172589 [Pelagophyceae sp. CCMP2097]|nr:hypothetical protein M885DRAFT_172589 [Pelagophyceae sp. CCMP2097]
MRPTAALAAVLLGAAGARGADAGGDALGAETAAVTERVLFKLVDVPQRAAGDGQRARRAAAVGASLGCPATSRLFRNAGKHEASQAAAGLNLWYSATCDSPEAAALALAGAELEGVSVIEAELIPATFVISNDARLNRQPHYNSINLFQAWDVERGSPNVVVQVLDTGLDMAHEDFQSNIWLNTGEICGNDKDDDNNGAGSPLRCDACTPC